MEGRTRSGGFTIVEMAVSMGIFALLMVTMFSIAIETSGFIADNDAETTVQMEGARSLQRFTDLVRKSGRVDAGGMIYPRVINGGTELEFRVLADLDGNGYPFDDTTGELEWNPAVFTVKADEDGNLAVYSGSDVVYFLGRYVSNLRFQTISENPALGLREVLVNYETRKPTPRGDEVVYIVRGSVHMRN